MGFDMEVEITPLTVSEVPALSALLLRQRAEYMEHFTPFPFDSVSLAARVEAARGDQYWMIRLKREIAGFFMLRGFDEGFQRPAFGVFVAEEFAGLGLGRKALQESLSWCRERQIQTVMLKVHPKHLRALSIYEGEGFQKAGVCEKTGYTMMEAHLLMSGSSEENA